MDSPQDPHTLYRRAVLRRLRRRAEQRILCAAGLAITIITSDEVGPVSALLNMRMEWR